MSDKRKYPRVPRFDLGTVYLKGTAAECIVHDVSEGGACLQVPRAESLPSTFAVSLAKGIPPRACRIAWRCFDRLGILFQGRSHKMNSAA